MKKLIITIPAYNEEGSIAEVIKSIPRKITGIDKVEVMVLSDGSIDKTVEIAKQAGADYVYQNDRNLGLAKTFAKLMEYAYEAGADYVVNTDADNQYDQTEIKKLVKPLVQGKADMVLGDRQVETLQHMPLSKKIGNRIGSTVIRFLSGVSVQDASTGFRAYSREFLAHLHLFSAHTYTHETIIYAANNKYRIKEVPITFKSREYGQSRLISGVIPHIQKSMVVIIRSILMYNTYKFLVILGIIFITIGALIGARFLYFYLNQGGQGMIQSLILASILISVGFTTVITGVLADLIKINRELLQKLLYEQKNRK
ncbi:MAG: glycosyltransferase family 2 protein [Minisyncoccia bacterium]